MNLDDYYGRDNTEPIEIELTYDDLTDAEAETFESRVREGRLTVTRVFDGGASSGRYHGVVPQDPDFRTIREAPNFTAKRNTYNALRTAGGDYVALPTVQSAAALDDALGAWEQAHPGQLVLMRDDGQFFGFQNAGRGALQRHTSFVFIPAVREASIDATDAKSSAIQRLLQLVVRSAILKKAELVEQKSTNAMFS